MEEVKQKIHGNKAPIPNAGGVVLGGKMYYIISTYYV